MGRRSRVGYRRFAAGLGLGILSIGLAGLHAQEPTRRPSASTSGDKRQPAALFSGSPLFWQTDQIIEYVVATIARHYNLTEPQEEYTRKLLTQRVKRFLSEHERETRTLMAEYMGYQISGQLPPPEVAREFARRARPMIAAIHKEIVDGNMKWREILNEEQKKKHDRDLEYIDRSFERQDRMFEKWSRGQVDPADLQSALSPQARRMMRAEDAWAYYVIRFKQDYRLDPGQSESADSVLRLMRQEAAAYREAHKQEFADLEARYQELVDGGAKTDPDELAELRRKREELDRVREKLERPINVEMFERLKKQLAAIPRTDQKDDYEKRRRQLERAAERARKDFLARRPTTMPTDTREASDTAPGEGEPAERTLSGRGKADDGGPDSGDGVDRPAGGEAAEASGSPPAEASAAPRADR